MQRDSRDYHILENAVKLSKDVDGFTCEIGVREGGGSQCILETLLRLGKKKIHVAIDPFGNIEYEHWETRKERLNYSNDMKNRMLAKMYDYCYKNKLEVLFFPLEDSEFFVRYADGIPVYNSSKTVCNTYSLVFFDGPHTTDLVKKEFDFFKTRVAKGGCLVFDDIDQYPHMQNVDEYVKSNGFAFVEKTSVKIAYVKT